MRTKDFKLLCEKFAIGLDQLRRGFRDEVLTPDKFKEICKSIAQQVRCAVV
tara:strand:+ start:700 stop:852 length:153 start_codon:yes stop_codon:yes gene_type:complete